MMTEIIEAKSYQVPKFEDALLKSKKSSILIETTYNEFWASGLNNDAPMHTSRSAWPGNNELGDILSDVQCTY